MNFCKFGFETENSRVNRRSLQFLLLLTKEQSESTIALLVSGSKSVGFIMMSKYALIILKVIACFVGIAAFAMVAYVYYVLYFQSHDFSSPLSPIPCSK
jgi:hypothetical protein